MNNSIASVPFPKNEPIRSYEPNSEEKKSVLKTYNKLKQSNIEVPMWINGKSVKSSKTHNMSPPHNHKHSLGKY